MTPPDDAWAEPVRQTLLGFDEALLRQVANKLCRPRNVWPVEELVERIVAALQNPVMLDRRLKELPAGSRQLLAIVARSRQPRWPVGRLVEVAATLGHADGLEPVVTLLESGLLLPELAAGKTALRAFDAWLTLSSAAPPVVTAPPLVMTRARHEDLNLPDPPGVVEDYRPRTVVEADGLDWPLRLAALWQQALGGPLRRTQQGEFFKRDHDRLRGDPLLNAPLTDGLAAPADPAFFAVALAAAAGLLTEQDAELTAADFSPAWKAGLPTLLAELWAALPWLRSWNAAAGWTGADGVGNPYPSAYLLAVLLLTRLPEHAWAAPAAIDAWLAAHHPFWQGQGAPAVGAAEFLLGVAHPLRLLHAAKGEDGGWLVRLSPVGRWVLGADDPPPATPTFPQTLLVQPNLEILAYRQGLTPPLVVALTRLATWKGLGAACTLQLEPHSVYRALEAGETLQTIVQTLERHGMKATPTPVLDSLRTWADKRERLTVYSGAALFEFATAAELSDALARGLPAVRLTDRLAAVPSDRDIDYRQFRLTGTRDYLLPPEKCVDVEADGVTLSVDLARSDLLLETEVQRFAEPLARPGAQGRRFYRLTPASVAAGRQNGVGGAALEAWFPQRTGLPVPPAARLLLTAPDSGPLELRRQLVLHLGSAELADGLQQWPGTRSLILARLGPTAVVVAEEHVDALTARLTELGARLRHEA